MDKLAIVGVLPSATVNLPQCFSLISFDPLSSGGFTLLYSPYLFNPTTHLSTILPRTPVSVSFPTAF